ncbi:MAG: VRR-NUC domain-containing protein [Methanogenium sp.]|jgi:hypothetical protein
MTEHDLQNLIRLELTKLGWITFRVNVGKVKLIDGRYFDTGLPPGFSDLMALKDGKTIFIEVKAEKGKVSKAQKNFIEQMKKNGFAAGIAYNMNDVFEILKGS